MCRVLYPSSKERLKTLPNSARKSKVKRNADRFSLADPSVTIIIV